MTDQTIIIVTATVFNADGDNDTGSAWMYENGHLDTAKETAFEIAEERFNDNFLNMRGVIYHVDHVKVPKLPSATVEATPTIESPTLDVEGN